MSFVESVDTLFGVQVIPLVNDDRFPSGPPLVKGGRHNSDKRSLKLHKIICRSGLPPQYRCAVWITSVARIANPQLSVSEIESYGTIAHAKNINAQWTYALGMTLPNPQVRDDAISPDFGLGQQGLHQLIHFDYGEWNTTLTTLPQQGNKKSIPDDGVKALTGVLCVIHQVLGIEYCPPLPDIAAILLTHMPESFVFATIREMIDDTSHFLPVSQKDYYAWCKTYAFFVEKMFPHHYQLMRKCGVLDPLQGGLDPIFKRFFVTLLKRDDLLRFMDVFVIDGGKAIFRLGLSMLHLISKKAIGSLPITDSSSWWSEIRRRTHDRQFSFQSHLQLMFPKFETISMRYPRRSLLGRMNRFHEKWALEIMPTLIDETPPKPLSITASSSECVLAKQANVRMNLAKWIPPSLQSTKLNLIYSTEKHGRSFVSFYNECHKAKNTVLLVEAINGNVSSIVGMFASHAWAINHHSLGDGHCFLFRIDPIPKCWYWTPDVHASTNLHDLENLAVREQFMIARSDFIAMGANREGTNGLRLYSDLSKGESHSAAGFDNEPLAGQHHKTFDVGIVELYQLVRDF